MPFCAAKAANSSSFCCSAALVVRDRHECADVLHCRSLQPADAAAAAYVHSSRPLGARACLLLVSCCSSQTRQNARGDSCDNRVCMEALLSPFCCDDFVYDLAISEQRDCSVNEVTTRRLQNLARV